MVQYACNTCFIGTNIANSKVFICILVFEIAIVLLLCTSPLRLE